ncbi:MAG TPA: hypothetical protein VGJ05_08795 [Fimbriiglobus sp.]|jgi:hypothetical protein
MPIHDWTRVDAGLFHHFHERWISAIGDALNGGLLPKGYVALSDQSAGVFPGDFKELFGSGSPEK